MRGVDASFLRRARKRLDPGIASSYGVSSTCYRQADEHRYGSPIISPKGLTSCCGYASKTSSGLSASSTVLVTVQRCADSAPDFYVETVRAVVELCGLVARRIERLKN